jgi:hypothetical protein
MIFSSLNVLVLDMIWSLSPQMEIWPYSALLAHNQASTFQKRWLLITNSVLTFCQLSFLGIFSLSNYFQVVVPQEHCCGWKLFSGAYENEATWSGCLS